MLVVRRKEWRCTRCASSRSVKDPGVCDYYPADFFEPDTNPRNRCRNCVENLLKPKFLRDHLPWLSSYWNAVRAPHDKGLIRVED